MVSPVNRDDYRFSIGDYNPPIKFVDFSKPSDLQLEDVVFPIYVADNQTVVLKGLEPYDTVRVEFFEDVGDGKMYHVEVRIGDKFAEFGVGISRKRA